MTQFSQHHKVGYLRVVWNQSSIGALAAATTAVNRAGGAVVQAHSLSDLQLILRVEIDADSVQTLQQTLCDQDFQIHAPIEIDPSPSHENGEEWVVHLAIVLALGRGDKWVLIPAVPG